MSVVCEVCGKSNRSKSKYCTGCAHPLPGSGLSRVDPVMAFRPSAAGAPRADDGERESTSIVALPAEAASFWLRAGCVGVAMILGFTLWWMDVTRKPGVPPLHTRLLAMLAPAPGRSPTPPATPEPAAGSTKADAPEQASPAPAATAPVAERPSAQVPAKPAETKASPVPGPQAKAKAAPRPATRSSSLRRKWVEPSTTAEERAVARAERDLGPPIAPGPGPQYGGAHSATLPFADLGPPIAPGPGPRYDYSRTPVQAPSSRAAGPPPR
ncbi:hypothetical protein AB4Z46_21450 [Variovorax sp. M-6]|uniref:hypothetical protein n=1 Tax=Variovorax sp. M-6 TaxID=3233041 RepID=UPI003F9EA8EB